MKKMKIGPLFGSLVIAFGGLLGLGAVATPEAQAYSCTGNAWTAYAEASASGSGTGCSLYAQVRRLVNGQILSRTSTYTVYLQCAVAHVYYSDGTRIDEKALISIP